MLPVGSFVAILVAAGLLLAAVLVFGRVRRGYRTHGHLLPAIARLQTGFFFVYAFSSYLFLHSDITDIWIYGWLLFLAFIFMGAGLLVVLFSMPKLGRRSFGQEMGQLHTAGLYRFSRNPQLAGSFSFIVGYALLWPSWTGALWAAVWLPIAHMMVMAEEEHLTAVFGKEYEAYCRQTPRYLGVFRDGSILQRRQVDDEDKIP